MRTLLIASCILKICTVHAQTWSAFPYSFNSTVRYLYTDTSANTLYAVGQFFKVDNDSVPFIFGYTGNDSVHLSKGLYGDWINRAINYKGNLYVCGPILEVEGTGEPCRCWAVWNGMQWDSITNQNFIHNIDGLSVVDDTLYASGGFDTLGHHPCEGVAAYYNGQIVKCFGGFPNPNAHHVAGVIKYDGELYAYGQILDSIGGEGQLAIGRWNPPTQTWDRVANAFAGDYVSGVWDAEVYNGELYVCGDFPQSANVAGSGIMKWNGVQWHGIGGLNGWGRCMVQHNGVLYVGGYFTQAGGVTSYNVAAFDGENWIALNDTPLDDVIAMAVFQDQLYVAGPFWQVGGEPIKFVARYNQPLPVGLSNLTLRKFRLFPNPTHQAVNLTLPQGTTQFEIFNAVGQSVYESNVSSLHQVVDVTKFSEGVYFVRVRSHQGVQTQKFIKIDD